MNRLTPRTWRTDDCLLYRESKASVISLDLHRENQSTPRLQRRQRGARRHKGLFFLVARMSKSALSSFFYARTHSHTHLHFKRSYKFVAFLKFGKRLFFF